MLRSRGFLIVLDSTSGLCVGANACAAHFDSPDQPCPESDAADGIGQNRRRRISRMARNRSREVMMKMRSPLDPGKALRKQHFPAMPQDADRCHEPAAVGARKASRSSLKIRQLGAAHFRTQLSAAPLKHLLFALKSEICCDFRTQLSAAPLKLDQNLDAANISNAISALN